MAKTAPRRSEINVTPYIDILLVLLIIFMVIQPTRQYDLETRVPDAPATESAVSAPRIVVTVDQDFRLAVNAQPVAVSQLGTKLFEILRVRGDRTVFVLGAEGLPFASVARVIDIAKGAGAGDIGLDRLQP